MWKDRMSFSAYFTLLLTGIAIGFVTACFLALIAVDRRDAMIIDHYHTVESVRSRQAEQSGQALEAYVHQSSAVYLMEEKKKALDKDFIPWTFFAPLTFTVTTSVLYAFVPPQKINLEDRLLQNAKERQRNLREKLNLVN